MTALEAVAWMRVCRPGCVIGYQQTWLEEVEPLLWDAGDKYRYVTKPFSLWELVSDIAGNETAWRPQKNLLGAGRSEDYQIKNRKQLTKMIKFKLQYQINYELVFKVQNEELKVKKILRQLFCSGCFYVIGRHLILIPIHIYKIHEISFQYCVFKIDWNVSFVGTSVSSQLGMLTLLIPCNKIFVRCLTRGMEKWLETQPLFLWYSAFIKYCGGAACFSYTTIHCML